MTTPIDVVNQALQMIDAQTQIVSFTDIPAGTAAAVLYVPTVNLLLRQLDPDFARFTAPLVAAAAVTPPLPWQFAYEYPSDCLRMRQVAPSPGSYNINDPFPVLAQIAMGLSQPSSVPTKIIAANLMNALGVYTTSLVTENQWESIFQQAVVRQLANPLAMALAGRPDFAKDLLQTAMQYEQMQELTDESMARSA